MPENYLCFLVLEFGILEACDWIFVLTFHFQFCDRNFLLNIFYAVIVSGFIFVV